jgi:hypothetical protein
VEGRPSLSLAAFCAFKEKDIGQRQDIELKKGGNDMQHRTSDGNRTRVAICLWLAH